MNIRVLGCSGGIGDGLHTTSFLVDDDILIDAGTGVTRLGRQDLVRIDHVFLTHSHLDHILALPLLLDSVAGERHHPLVLHALPEVLDIIKAHLFNWRIWPDFSRLPSEAAPFLSYAPLAVGVPVYLAGREITALPAHHVVPACGYLLRGAQASLLFSGDTASHPALWQTVANTADLRYLLVECSFPEKLSDIAQASLHYSPAALAADIAGLRADLQVWISHLKPGGEAAIMADLDARLPGRCLRLAEDQRFEL